MISTRLLLILSLWFGWVATLSPLCAQTTTSEGTALSSAQWAAVQARYEGDISALLTWLKDYQNNKNVLNASIADLQAKTTQLRAESRGESNVFKDIRLKELLNELKDKLEQ